MREQVAMCTGGRLVADFVAGADARPNLRAELEDHLTTTVNGLWVVWAYKLARPEGELFVPLTGGCGYPTDARAKCLKPRAHNVPDPGCTCGFHALSSQVWRDRISLMMMATGIGRGFMVLSVALSGRVLAFEWAGGGVLWRAERQTVVRAERPDSLKQAAQSIGERRFAEGISMQRRRPGDSGGRPAVVTPVAPRDSGPMRLDLPGSAPVLPVCHDDAGWCAVSGTFGPAPRSLVLT